MRLKSAVEDFERNTLALVTGLLARFFYVGRLHDGRGSYEHWGLTKVYGVEAAQRAIRAAHRVLLAEILKRPVAALLQDVPVSCSHQRVSEREFMATLPHASPKPLSPAARAHLGSVWNALSALLESRNSAIPQAASPPPPPGQESQPPAGT